VVNVYKSSNTVQINNWNELQWSLSEVCELISEVWGLYVCWRLFVTFWHHLYKIIKQKRKQSRFLKSEKKRKLRLEHCCTVAWRASSATAERLNCHLYIQITSYDPAIPSQLIVSSLTRSEWNSRKGRRHGADYDGHSLPLLTDGSCSWYL